MAKRSNLPVALTIAGSDSGGGAGVQADLKTFASLGVHGSSAITCITAQNPRRISGIQECSAKVVRQQIAAVFEELRPAAIKTGMLYSDEIVHEVARYFRSQSRTTPLIVDPVMVASSGKPLLKRPAIKTIKEQLLPISTLVTPNVREAEILLGKRIQSVEDLRAAAREVRRRYGCAALVKGGHLSQTREAIDFFYDGKNELLLSAPFVRGISTHGTGCTYSAAIAGYCALGRDLPGAVAMAKEYVTQTIAHARLAARHAVLNHFWKQ